MLMADLTCGDLEKSNPTQTLSNNYNFKAQLGVWDQDVESVWSRSETVLLCSLEATSGHCSDDLVMGNSRSDYYLDFTTL